MSLARTQPPRIFICDEWVYGIQNNAERIKNALNGLNEDSKEMTYIFAFSLFESALSEAYRQFLFAFPEKFSNKEERKIDVSRIYSHLYNPKKLWFEIVNDEVKKKAKGDTGAIFEYVSKQFSVSVQFDKSHLREITDLRNRIAHENTNSSRSYAFGRKLHNYTSNPSDLTDYKRKINVLIDLLSSLATALYDKYGKYTALKFMEEFWGYVFGTPILPFSRTVDTCEKTENGKKMLSCRPNFEYIKTIHKSLSSTEKFYLVMLLLQYGGSSIDQFYKFNDLPSLIGRDKAKFVWLLQVLDIYPFLFEPIEGISYAVIEEDKPNEST
jgi:hypothetical protein